MEGPHERSRSRRLLRRDIGLGVVWRAGLSAVCWWSRCATSERLRDRRAARDSLICWTDARASRQSLRSPTGATVHAVGDLTFRDATSDDLPLIVRMYADDSLGQYRRVPQIRCPRRTWMRSRRSTLTRDIASLSSKKLGLGGD